MIAGPVFEAYRRLRLALFHRRDRAGNRTERNPL